MSSYTMTIFTAPTKVAEVTGRYICLLRGNTESENRYLEEDSIVVLAKELEDKQLDWAYIENELLQNGIFQYPA